MARFRYEQILGRAAGYTPPSGAWMQPSHLLSPGTGSPASGSCYLVPIDVGPNPLAIQKIGVHVSTALTGGGTVTCTLGVYRDNGTGGQPLLTSTGLVTSGTIALTTTGRATVTTSTTLAVGRYWLAISYNATTTPTQAAVLQVIGNSTALWNPDSAQIGAVSRGLLITGLTGGLPTTSQTITTTGTNVPIVEVQAA